MGLTAQNPIATATSTPGIMDLPHLTGGTSPARLNAREATYDNAGNKRGKETMFERLFLGMSRYV